jgi:ParB-like chromosome segregation protein Spo0J
MTDPVKIAFQLEPIDVPIDKILATRKSTARGRSLHAIAASMSEVGIVEMPVVFPIKDGSFLLLDGHQRIETLKGRGETKVQCLLALDDENYTYNRHVSRIAPIQHNRMILKARAGGVSDERIATTLSLSVETVRSYRSMLSGICPEAIDALRDKPIGEAALRQFKHVKPMRQLEMADLMNASANYTASYAKALVSVTPDDERVDTKAAKPALARPADLARMESEMDQIRKEFLAIDESYGRDVLNLTVVRAYLKRLLDNGKIVRLLASKYPEILTEFQHIVEADSLESAA